MKKIFLLISGFCIAISAFSQIKTIKIEEKKKEIIPYDSLENINQYTKERHIGQTLYLMPTKENEQNGIQFYTSMEERERYGNYESLKGKYFKLIDVVKGNRVQDIYLQLIETDTQDTVYCRSYLSSDIEPFLTVGYFEKLQTKILGKRFVYMKQGNNPNSIRNIDDRKPRTDIPEGIIFEATDVVIDELYKEYDEHSYMSPTSPLIVLLSNVEHGKGFISHKEIEDSFLENGIFSSIRNFISHEEHERKLSEEKERKDLILKKFGATKGKLILEGKVRIGFTAEMCRYSWGEPRGINRTTGSYGVHEQWVYGSSSYLYFENGILTTIQN
ncbi:MAG: hypothetical protein LBG18_07795 [Mediterranea sp.]|jgi:hypothetical protein|nr:hypothetical protein [Mediterranea sp.]